MYVAVFNMKEVGSFTSFKDAFKKLYDLIIGSETISQMSWEMIWIEDPSKKTPVMFFDARDKAVDEGWLVDGKWRG